jgi:hypothetical protein
LSHKIINNYVKDVNECLFHTSNCSANGTCVNTVGSYTCSCPAGFYGNGLICLGKFGKQSTEEAWEESMEIDFCRCG